ncbi:MAG: PepSY domain-containing protein [Acidimicrobiales bacterium]
MDTHERNQDDAAPKRRLNSSIVAAGVAFGITLAGLGVAAAQTDDTTPSTEATPDTTVGTTGHHRGDHRHDRRSQAETESDSEADKADKPARAAETELTGDAAEKVKAAALAAVPGGTIIRVETDSDGSPYEAHVRKADGTEVVVKIDANFAVTATEEGHGRGGHGRGGRGGGETALTGETADKVSAAALAAVPGGTIIRVETDADGTYEAHVRKADGTEVVVKVDAGFNVTATEEGGGRGHHRGGPDDDADDTESGTGETD